MSRRIPLLPLFDKVLVIGVMIALVNGDYFAGYNIVAHVHDEIVAEMREALIADPYVGAVFVGPSGEGLKAIVRIDPERHRESWFAAEAHFLSVHGLKLDKSTKDPLRLCFVSHDPQAEISEFFEILPLPDLGAASEHLKESAEWRPPLDTTSADIVEMLRFCPPRPDYDTWLRIASAVWSVLPAVEGAQVLAQWSPEERDGEYMAKHKARLEQVGIGTLVHIASLNGFDARAAWRRKRWAGRIRFAEGTRSPVESEDPERDTAPWDIRAEADIPRERIMEAFDNGQVGDARLWCELRRGLRVWNLHSKVWMIYQDGIWVRDDGHTTILDISDTLSRIYEGMANSIRAEIAEKPAPDGAKDIRAKEVIQFIKRREMIRERTYNRKVEQYAQEELQIPAQAFNQNSELLCVQNGTIDFAEGVFREHRPTDFITHMSPIIFNPDAECPQWDEFLTYFLAGDRDLINYIARAIGYSLTGRVDEDALFFLYGKGANGKSTLISVKQMLLGQLMTRVPISALLSEKSDSNYDYQKAKMEGRRVVVTDEIPEGRNLSENQVKALVGGDTITARRPFEMPYDFTPTHKLWLVGNHKLNVKGTDHGIWRRIHLVPFTVTIPDSKKRLRHDVLAEFRRELPGILNWAIRGYLEMQTLGGLRAPASVVEATAEYRKDSDQFGRFLGQCMVRQNDEKTALTDILKAYHFWCNENGEPETYGSTVKISRYFRDQGFKTGQFGKNNTTHVIGWLFEDGQGFEENQKIIKF
jgi:putative DNA primase/helicase